MKLALALSLVAALALAGCSKNNVTGPASSLGPAQGTASSMLSAPGAVPLAARPAPGKPGYEPAYEDGRVLTINAIEVPGKAPAQAQADFYEVIYPTNWQALGIPAPQCNPCDHDGNGIDALDYHDHVLDSSPGDPEYRAPWHVYAVVPAYSGDPTHDAAIDALYKAHLPLMSEQAVLDFAQMTLPDHSPVAIKIDTNFYFLCAVVNPHAAR